MFPASEFRWSSSQCHALSLEVLDASPDVIYLLDRDLRITYCNPAWDQFALANEGETVTRANTVGTLLMSHISQPLHSFYHEVFSRAAASGKMFDFDYECSSANVYRLHHMNVMPFPDGSFAVVNSTRIERLHGPDVVPFLPSGRFVSTHSMITMCSHCRRTRREAQPEQWDWVPEYLKLRSTSVTQGLCPICTEYFYGPEVRGIMVAS